MEYRFKVTPQMVEDRVKDMKDYLLDIAGVPPSEETPLPQLERHQAWLLLGGYKKQYKNLETYDLGANTFSYYIFPDVSMYWKTFSRPNQNKQKALCHLWHAWILF